MAHIDKVKELFLAAQFMPQLEAVVESQMAIEESALAKTGDTAGLVLAEVKRRLHTLYIDNLLVLVQRQMQDHLSDDEIDELIAIYRSPLYEKFIALVPGFLEIIQSSLGGIEAFIEEHVGTIAGQVVQEFQSGRRTSGLQ